MATIQIKRNNSNAATKPSSLLVGELAGNLLDRSLFSSDGSNVFQFYTGTTKWFDTSGNANNANKLGGTAASSYATQAWVEGKKYLTAIPSEYITETELSNTLGGYQTKITSSNKLAYSLISGTPSSLPASDVYAWAKAATKPSYAFSEITGKPTTLAGYGITNGVSGYKTSEHLTFGFDNVRLVHYGTEGDWRLTNNGWTKEYILLHSNNYSSYALPLSGGTLTGPLHIDSSSSSDQPLALRSNAADASGACRIQFIDANNAFQGYVMSGWGNLLLAHRSYNQIGVGDSGIWCSSDNGTTKNTLIHSGNIGSQSVNYASSAGSATKLQTARNLWGQSFDGTGDVSGGLADVTSILFNTANGIGIYRGTVYSSALTATDIAINGGKIVLNPTGNVLIGTTSDNGGKLQVVGGPVKVLMASSLDDAILYGERVDLGYRIGIGVGTSANRGIYDTKLGWCFQINTSNSLTIVSHTVSGNLTVEGDGFFGSDARYKSKIQDLAVDVETIANAPVFSYKWTDREDDKVHLGTTAQYWLNTNFKDAVDISNKDFFHLNYGALGVAIGVSLAKKTFDHEERIKALEEENKELKNELKQLKQWHN